MSRWIRSSGSWRLQESVEYIWNCVPTASTQSDSSMAARNGSTCGKQPRARGWSSGIAPRPSREVTTGMRCRSANTVNRANPPADATPPPAQMSGRSALASRAAARSMGRSGVSIRGRASRPRRIVVSMSFRTSAPTGSPCMSMGYTTAPGWRRPDRMSAVTSLSDSRRDSVDSGHRTQRHTVCSISVCRGAS